MADQLIRALALREKKASPGDRETILETISSAKFNPKTRTLGEWEAYAPRYWGFAHPSDSRVTLAEGTQLSSLDYHALKHRNDGSFQKDTTPEEYLVHLHNAARHPSASIKVGVDGHGKHCAVIQLQTFPPSSDLPKLIPAREFKLLVVYNEDIGCIVSGYRYLDATSPDLFKPWKRRTLLVMP